MPDEQTSKIAKMWREDPTFRAMAMTYLDADEEVVKHLIGSHEQKDHDPTKRGSHSRGQHAQGGKTGGKVGAAIGGGLGAARAYGITGHPAAAIGGALSGALMGGATGAQLGGTRLFGRQAGKVSGVANLALNPFGTIGRQGIGALQGAPAYRYGLPEGQWKKLKGKKKDDEETSKSADEDFDSNFTAVGEFSKVDEDKQQVFGWASIVEKDGTPVVDLQGDFISPGDLEQAAYDYVLDSRVGGEMHQRVGKSAPKEVGTLIESMVITPEKVSKLGLPEGSLPTGWWVGYQVKDPQVWSKVKKGEYAGFSIHGYGKRKAVSKEEVGKSHDVRETLIAKSLQFAQDQQSFAKNLWVTAQALEERGQRNEAVYFGKLAVSIAEAGSDED